MFDYFREVDSNADLSSSLFFGGKEELTQFILSQTLNDKDSQIINITDFLIT